MYYLLLPFSKIPPVTCKLFISIDPRSKMLLTTLRAFSPNVTGLSESQSTGYLLKKKPSTERAGRL